MKRVLLILGGIFNTIFFLFHIFLGYRIQHIPSLQPNVLGMLQALNVAGVLLMLFFAVSSFFMQHDLTETKLGRTVLGLVVLVFASRAVEEFFLFRFNLSIFVSCLVVAVVYAAVLVVSLRAAPQPRTMKAAA